MKIIDAYWELRNLEVTTQEVEIEPSDTIDSVRSSLYSLNAKYQVIKVPTAQFGLYSLLSELGFTFVEASIRVSHTLKEVTCSKIIKRISDDLSFEEMDEEKNDIMNVQIKAGMFQTDRIILDPYFSSMQAANRYIFWMKDEKDRGAHLFSYMYKGLPIGFSCMKETQPGVFYPVLGGVYNTGKTLPLGSAIVYKQLEIAKKLGGKELYTIISANNPVVVRAYSQLGYVFEDIKYIFIKHQ